MTASTSRRARQRARPGPDPVLTLPPRLDLPAARPLADDLRARDGRPLDIDAGEVSHLGGLCLQVLLAAAQSWRKAGQPLRLTRRSPAFDEALALCGLGPEALEAEAMEAVAGAAGPAAPAEVRT